MNAWASLLGVWAMVSSCGMVAPYLVLWTVLLVTLQGSALRGFPMLKCFCKHKIFILIFTSLVPFWFGKNSIFLMYSFCKHGENDMMVSPQFSGRGQNLYKLWQYSALPLLQLQRDPPQPPITNSIVHGCRIPGNLPYPNNCFQIVVVAAYCANMDTHFMVLSCVHWKWDEWQMGAYWWLHIDGQDIKWLSKPASLMLWNFSPI